MKTNRVGNRAITLAVLAPLILLSGSPSALYAQSALKQRPAPDRLTTDPEVVGPGERVRRETPDSVKIERDIVYARYGKRELLLDLYRPKQPASDKIPCIVVVTGGGWTQGDKTRFAIVSAHLASQGFAAACITYRLLPEVEFPAPITDCKAAVRWVRANAAQYGLDPDRIGALGGSAGAHLVAMLATSSHQPELEGDGGNAGVSSRVQAVVGMATPTDMTRYAERTKLKGDMIALVSPVTHVSKDSAPLLLLHGTKDGTVPMAQAELQLEKYRQAGASAELVKIPDGVHAFWNFERWFDDVMKRSVEFFRRQLGQADAGTEPRPKSGSLPPARVPPAMVQVDAPPALRDNLPATAPAGTAYRPDSPSAGQPMEKIAPPGGSEMVVFKTVGDAQIKLWIDLPKGPGPFPVMIYVHGGGWSSAMAQGQPDQFAQHSARMARLGVAGVRIFYRGRQTVTVKETMEDVMDAVKWTRQNAGKYRLDLTRLGMAGGSAGGHLAALAAQRTPECVCYVGLNGVYDMVQFRRQLPAPRAKTARSELPGGDGYWGSDEQLIEYSPAHQLRSPPPETLLLHGTADTTVPFETARAFAETIRAKNGSVTLKLFEGEPHGFFNFNRPYYEPAMKAVEQFLVRVFKLPLPVAGGARGEGRNLP